MTALILLVIGLGSFWLATGGTLDPNYAQPGSVAAWPGDYYRQQAIAMLDGRLDVPYTESDFTECFFRDDRCYGYFGLTPSIIRLAGFAVTASTDTNPSPVIIATGVTVAVWAAIYLAVGLAGLSPGVDRLTPRSRLWLILLVGGLLGPGGILTFLSQGKLYYEAVVVMIAGLLVAFALVQRWVVTRRPIHLIIASSAAIVATNARPTAIVPSLVLGAGVALLAARGPAMRRRQDVLLALGLAVLPALSAFGVMWLKLRTLSPSYPTYAHYNSPKMQQVLQANDGDLQGIRFVLNNLVNHLRPDALSRIDAWPWVQHAVPREKPPLTFSPVSIEGMYVEATASLTNTMPVALLLTCGFTLAAIIGIARFTTMQRQTFVILFLASAPVPIGALTIYTLTTRYLGDYFPLLAVGTVFGLIWLLETCQSNAMRFRIVSVGLAASAVVTFFINLGLQKQTFTTLIG